MVGENPYGAIKSASLTIEDFVLDLASLTWDESPDSLVGSQAVGSHPKISFEMDDYHSMLTDQITFTLADSKHAPEISNDSYGYGLESYFDYRLNLDFQVDSGDQFLLNKARASLHQLIRRVIVLLVASGKDVVEAEGGHALVLLEGGSERSFLRVGTFGPHGDGHKIVHLI